MGGRFLKGENLFYKKLKFNHIKFKTDKSCFLSVSSDLKTKKTNFIGANSPPETKHTAGKG